MNRRYRTWGEYFVFVVAVAAALEVRYLLIDNTHEDTTFLAAVAVAAVVGGLWTGLLAAGLSAVIIAGDYPILFHDAEHPLATALFFLSLSILISGFCGLLKASQQKAHVHAQEAAILRDRIISISEAEQRRIGQDLHDNIGQQLTGIAFLSQSLAKRLSKREAPETEDARRIVTMVSQTVGWTRDLARGLTPVALETDDLVLALRRLAESATTMFQIQCEFSADEPAPLASQDAAIHLYRIAQEAVNNAAKHSNATQVLIELRSGASTELRVRDNGRGFDPTHVKPGGLGLEIMGHRARLIGATLVVRAGDEGGTLVSCTVARVSSAHKQ